MPAIEARSLGVGFRTERGVVQALTDATFAIEPGETLVVIGESGSGKTVLAHALMRLLPRNAALSGEILLEGRSLLDLPEAEMRGVRGREIALIPQGAGSALNPVRRVGGLMLEIARARGLKSSDARTALDAALRELDLSFDEVADRYPHQLSGGMQQRVVNSMAMVGKPAVVIADEPTHGLDPELVDTTADQLQTIARRSAALLVITHDLRLAARLGGRTALVYSSYIVELRDTAAFFAGPAHPYGRALLGALPERGGVAIPGVSPELTQLPNACAFAPHCSARFEPCDAAVPAMYTLPDGGEGRCYLHAER